MLQALAIRDFAIIDHVELDFGAGLTVITGETGAGKSILIDALNLILGGRARTEVIRTGAEEALVQALFSLQGQPEARARLEAAGVEAGEELVIRRVVARNGRHKVYLNGTLATVNMLAQVTGGLVDISGQHEHYSLLHADFHLELLDRVGRLGATRDAVRAAYEAVADLDARIADLRERQRDRGEREDFLRFQLQELVEAKLKDPEEEVELERESKRLGSVEKLRSAAAKAEQALYEDDGAVERLARAARAVATLAEYDADLAPVHHDLQTALALAEDAARTLSSYGRDLDADPDRLEQVEARLALLAKLRRKFGATLAEVIARKAEMEAELGTLANADDALVGLEKQRRQAAAELKAAADRLTAARRVNADKFVAAVRAELADLGMSRATLSVRIEPLGAGCPVGDAFVGPRGADRVEFLLSANPGEAPQPLNRIASGGELSRFMLAVKRVIAEADPVATYVFDEVDSGVGGPTADAIGRKLKSVSRARQALCITHLPQIAAMADHHLQVSKLIDGERTISQVSILDATARVEELARMLGGARVTQTTRAHAQELLAEGAKV